MVDIRQRFLEDDDADWVYENFPSVRKSPDTWCPTCDKKGTYRWKGHDYACDCVEQVQLLKHYHLAGIGATYHRLGWDDLDSDALVDKVAEYGTNPEYLRRGIGLFLVGDVGTGKTMVGTLCLKDFVKGGLSCYSTTFAMMIDMYASTWRSEEERKRFHRKMIRSQVLLLDDIGKESKLKNNLPEATFDLVLRSRVQSGLSTIVTSNITNTDELRRGYGAPVLSLLREKSIAIKVDGSDYRGKAHERELAEIAAGEVRPIQ